MKRTIPLLITAIGGFVLIVSFFIPATEGLGEVAAVWFDILAAIAFVLGGGNLLKVQLKKISDRVPGWGYAAVTLVAFLATLIVGLGKLGVPPARDQQFFGETFADLPLEAFPASQTMTVEGEVPERAEGDELPASVRRQLSQDNGQVVFRGWMLPHQRNDLMGWSETLRWRCTVERLAEAARPPEPLRGKVAYYIDHEALSFSGPMTEEAREQLLAMSEDSQWEAAVQSLYARSRLTTRLDVGPLPDEVDPATFPETITYDRATEELVAFGPVSVAQRNEVARQFPISRPLGPNERQQLWEELEARGELNEVHRGTFERILDGTWTVEQLTTALNEAGKPQEVEKTWCDLLQERITGEDDLQRTEMTEAVTLNAAQRNLLEQFATDESMLVDDLVEQLEAAGDFTEAQEAALRQFVSQTPTTGARNRQLWAALLPQGRLTREQTDFLLEDFRSEHEWNQDASRLLLAAHVPKYEWSGEYNAAGSAFAWIYEYLFKPLTATMFALLAFYVASAAFRAFRAKNIEAILLLGTAFIILLGRTFAGFFVTDWIPPDSPASGLRIENMTFYIMSIFNTAGNRAIMIGVALGIASTSLKILLGVDRSWLGSSEE